MVYSLLYIYLFIPISLYLSLYIYLYVSIPMYLSLCIYLYVSISMYLSLCIYLPTYLSLYFSIYLPTYLLRIDIQIHFDTCKHTYTDTYTHACRYASWYMTKNDQNRWFPAGIGFGICQANPPAVPASPSSTTVPSMASREACQHSVGD